MNARALALILAAILAGCATGAGYERIYNAEAQTYRAKGAERLSTINGRMHQSHTGHRLVVDIDGVTAIDGSIGTGDADISGKYQNKPTQALCSRKDVYKQRMVGFQVQTYLDSYTITCRIIIDGEFVATQKY